MADPAAALLPIALVMLAEARDMIGSKTAYAPALYSTNIFLVSIADRPLRRADHGLHRRGRRVSSSPRRSMAAGVKGILAVGTDLFHIFAKAIMGTSVHKKLGNVSVKLAVAFLVGSGRRHVHRRRASTRRSTTRTRSCPRPLSAWSMPSCSASSASTPLPIS